MVRRRYGAIPDIKDHNDYQAATLFAAAPLPSKFSLADTRPPRMNQGPLGSCTAHGTLGVARHHVIRRGTTYDFEMSRLGLYFNSRFLEGTIGMDVGAQIRDAVKALAQYGVAHENLWPYDPTKFAQKPPQEFFDDAVQYKAQAYYRVDVNGTSVRQAICQYHPVIIGIPVYPEFEGDEVGETGMVPMPTAGRSPVGYHCMFVDEYGMVDGRYTVVNSWGNDWGKDGVCYLPYEYIESPKYGTDYWIITGFGSDAEKAAGTAD